MPEIREVIITTRREDGSTHITPMGVHVLENSLMLAPFKPSTTLDNLQRHKEAVINYTDDVRVYAGSITGRWQWPTTEADTIETPRLQNCLAHSEIVVDRFEEDKIRPRFFCREIHTSTHTPFRGFNRAQSAVIEAAILCTRLHMLPKEKINDELAYLKIAIEKTAGPREQEAWEWLIAAIEEHRNKESST
ncbi:MAG TPA: DUF447 family protein [Chromatiales bacterium]|nr:DUF447 family protein [Thiotrichales bacterium]HIP69521.1 DUF447 family protein [Chromatiales bacterium]